MCLGVRLDQEALEELQEMLLQVFNAITAFPVFDFFPALTKRLLLRKRWARLLALRDRRDQVLLRLIRSRGRGRGGGAEEDQVPGGYCYADSLLELRVAEEGGRPLTDAEMVNLCSEFMIAATDTSLSMIEWIMAELVNRPDIQAKVYEEVRSQPDLSEGDNMRQGMPYLKALALEGLRLHPLGHLVIPHGVRSDGEVGGYAVPKGAELNFLVSDWGLDETVWPAAREFRPERFLEEEEDSDLDITGSRGIKMAPFGAGRRMCPGYTLAMLHAEFFVGSLVRDFQWLPPAQGQSTVDMTEDQASVICMKHPLRARIIPRTT